MYLNAQSIIKKVDELQCAAEIQKPDIILITESWCNSDISDAFLSIDGYEVQTDLRIDRGDTARGRGGGLLTYTRVGLPIVKMNGVFENLQGSAFKVRDLVIYLVYRSPNARPESIAELCDLVKQAGKNSIFFGDFNLPGIDWRGGTATGRAAEFMEAVDDALMEQMVEFATQVSGNTLDLVITNAPERITEVSEEGRLGSSDHTMIKVKISQTRQQETTKEIRNWRRADWSAMRKDMSRVKWKTELQGSTENAKRVRYPCFIANF